MNGGVQRPAKRVARQTQQAMPGSDWLETSARVGYAAKGVVYTIIGVLAVQAAFTSGGQTTGAKGAIQQIASAPFGQVLLIATALGLACYALWRLVMAAMNPTGESGAKGAVKRTGYAASGIVNLALAYFAARLVWGTGGGGGTSEQALTARLMSEPYGLWIVGIIGTVIISVGLYHFYRAYTAKFMRKYGHTMSGRQRRWARRIGRLGLSARGLAFCMIGAFFVEAAVRRNPDAAGGLGQAFRALLRQPYGPWLLGVVAIGFICYGIYCFSSARYRRFQTQTAIS